MRRKLAPTTYLTVEELHGIADEKSEEAATLPHGPERQEMLKSAASFRNLADMRGWLSGELRPPK